MKKKRKKITTIHQKKVERFFSSYLTDNGLFLSPPLPLPLFFSFLPLSLSSYSFHLFFFLHLYFFIKIWKKKDRIRIRQNKKKKRYEYIEKKKKETTIRHIWGKKFYRHIDSPSSWLLFYFMIQYHKNGGLYEV